MAEQLGEQKATALDKYAGVVSLTRVQAMEILKTIWPKAPEVEVLKAAIICHQYGLNPLMKHIALIPFRKRREGKVVGEDWAVVQGISSNRLLARRRHDYSYLDLTPRRMLDEEQEKINGGIDDTRIWAITKLKDMATGAEAIGVGSWPKDEIPYGTEKGNTKLNMACIRSERQALDRLYPADMPQGIEVMEEKYIDAQFNLVTEKETLKGNDKTGEPPELIGGAGNNEGETVLSLPKDETEKSSRSAARRDPSTIQTLGDLYTACSHDFNLTTRKAVWDELNVSSQEEIVDTPRDCYIRIASTRR